MKESTECGGTPFVEAPYPKDVYEFEFQLEHSNNGTVVCLDDYNVFVNVGTDIAGKFGLSNAYPIGESFFYGPVAPPPRDCDPLDPWHERSVTYNMRLTNNTRDVFDFTIKIEYVFI